jgi:predicted oxidoreductase (fatty acid repression mutant protein)
MQNSLSGEILPQLKQTTYPIKSPAAFSTNFSEIVVVVSPEFSAAYTVLTDYLKAFITRSHAYNTSLLSTNSTVASYFTVLYY